MSEHSAAGSLPPLPRRRSPRWMRVLLVVSLSMNLAVAGLVAGRAMRVSDAAELGRFNARLVSMLPRDVRPEARELLLTDVAAANAMRDSLIEADRAAIAALRTSPFDRDAMAAALDRREALLSERNALRIRQMLALADALPTDARAALSDQLDRRLAWRNWAGGHRGD